MPAVTVGRVVPVLASCRPRARAASPCGGQRQAGDGPSDQVPVVVPHAEPGEAAVQGAGVGRERAQRLTDGGFRLVPGERFPVRGGGRGDREAAAGRDPVGGLAQEAPDMVVQGERVCGRGPPFGGTHRAVGVSIR